MKLSDWLKKRLDEVDSNDEAPSYFDMDGAYAYSCGQSKIILELISLLEKGELQNDG